MLWRSARALSSERPQRARLKALGVTASRYFGAWKTRLATEPWLPVLIAAGYLIYVAANLPDLIAAVNWSSDATWARVVALELLPSRGAVNVGEASHLSTLWFLYLTRALPMREAIWDVSPYILSLAGLAFTGWACWRVAGRWAAVLGAAIGVAAGASVLITVLPQGMHGHTWAANGILAAYLVFLKMHRDDLGRLPQLAAGSVAAGGAGLTAASDPLFLASGLVPFVAAGVILWMVYRNGRNRRVAVTAAIVGGTAVVLAFLIGRLIHELGFRKTHLTDGYFFGSMQDLLASLQALLGNLLRLGNGYFFGQPLSLYSLAALGMGSLALVAVVLPVLRTLSIVRHRPGLSEKDQGAALYLLYFSLSLVGVIGAYCLSGFTVGGAAAGTRYLVPVFYAVAASVPVVAKDRNWTRLVAVAGATVFGLLSIAGRGSLYAYESLPAFQQMVADGDRVIAYLEDEGLTRGFTGYWTSHALTYRSDMRIHFYPAVECRQPVNDRICPFNVNVLTEWYRPQPDTRTFILVDPTEPRLIGDPPSDVFGPPAYTRQIGELIVFVYDYDVASRFSPGCSTGYLCPEEPM